MSEGHRLKRGNSIRRISRSLHHGAQVTFEVSKVNPRGLKQRRGLQVSRGGVANLKNGGVQWFHKATDVHKIVQHEDKKSFSLSVLHTYEYEGDDEEQVEKIMAAFENLMRENMAYRHVDESNTGSTSSDYVLRSAPYRIVSHHTRLVVDEVFHLNKLYVGVSHLSHYSSSDFKPLRVLGRGSFARVVLAEVVMSGELVALKMIDRENIFDERSLDVILNERDCLASMDNPFAVRLMGTMQTARHLVLVLQYIPGGELYNILRDMGTFPEEVIQFYAAEIVAAVSALHETGILFRDLKPENIMLNEKGHVVFTDFGVAKSGQISSDDRTDTFCGTPEYQAPEVVLGEPHGRGVDWWSVGILIYEMLFGKTPFHSWERKIMYEKIIQAEFSFPDDTESEKSQEIEDLISGLLHRTSSERLGSEDGKSVKLHPFFAQIDWSIVEKMELQPPFTPDVKPPNCVGKPVDEITEAEFCSESVIDSGASQSSTKGVEIVGF